MCLIFLAVDDVLSQSHKLGGQSVEVRRYIACLAKAEGDSVNRRLNVPEPFQLPITRLKLRFLKSSDVHTKALEAQMNMCHASIVWPETGDMLQINCTLSIAVKDCVRLAATWKDDAERNLRDFFETLEEKTIPVLSDLWDSITKKISEITIEQPQAVAVVLSKKDHQVSVVGLKDVALPLIGRLETICQQVQEEAEKQKQMTKQTIDSFELIETRMLLADKFPSKMEEKFKDTKVRINQTRNEIVIEGLQGEVNQVQLEMYKMKSAFAHRELPFPAKAKDFFMTKTVKDYIVKKLKNSQVSAVWEPVPGKDSLLVMTSIPATLDRACTIIQQSVLVDTRMLNPQMSSVVHGDKWSEMEKHLTEKHGEKLLIDTSEPGKAVIVTTDDVHKDVQESMRSFFQQNTMYTENLPLLKPVYRLMSKHHMSEVQRIASDLLADHVRIDMKESKSSLEITGTKSGIDKAKNKLKALIEQVQKQRHQISKPGLGDFMKSPKGTEMITTVEQSTFCTISSSDDDKESEGEDFTHFEEDTDLYYSGSQPGVNVRATCSGYGEQSLVVAFGDMSEMKVDAVVNTADDKLSLGGGLGKCLKMKGWLNYRVV